ncbi:pirin-like C-terminal cupin domain-containing protein [Pseudotabrizicola sp. L79]|uniref:pirin-like C-terminal cupin domain-containing protein n=1 Tax=Pseudotabrizicola sp. L79 TaxID=3118402 RepID=UPI002F938472
MSFHEPVQPDRVATSTVARALANRAVNAVGLLLFGGEAITDPIAMRCPFVMTSDGDLAQAYRAGKFGQITYPADHAAHTS